MGTEKRLILFFILSFLFISIWYKIYSPRPQLQQINKTSAQTESQNVTKKNILQTEEKNTFKKEKKQESILKEIKNKKWKIILTENGNIKNFYIIEKKSLVDLILNKEKLPFKISINGFDILEWKNTKDNTFVSSFNNIYLEKSFNFNKNSFWFDLNLVFKNTFKENKSFPIEISWPSGLGIDKKLLKENSRMMKVWAKTEKSVLKLKPKKNEITLTGDWISLTNRYFFIAIKSNKNKYFTRKENKIPVIGIKDKVTLFPSEEKEINIKFFISPKSYTILKKEKQKFEKAMGFGVFGVLSVIFLKILNFFHSITGNYGWSIIILTLLINILTFPLTIKNLKSMHAMKKLQPYIEQLRKKYKDDPQKLNVEMMHLYKIKGVNPLGGCLPLLLQIPIFWALFSMLRQTFELRGAPFILWIKDLASPDSLFGHIPKAIPIFGGWPVGPLPLLMGVMMYIQQKSQSTNDPQTKALAWMPIFFTLIFFQFPSGLVLYWLFNNILTFLEQKIFLKDI